jgi:putative membrane protein
VIAGVVFNIMVMITHIPALVNQSVSNGPLHYSLHILVVTASLLMWVPVLCPDPTWQISYGGKMIYLFLMSVVPTVPAAWLTFAEGVVYKHYDISIRVWGLSVTTDQQLAGAVMKTGGSIFLWTIVTFLFFRRFMARWSAEQVYRAPDTLTQALVGCRVCHGCCFARTCRWFLYKAALQGFFFHADTGKSLCWLD